MRGKHIYIRKTCNVRIQHEDVYMCVCNYLWLFGNMSLYKSDYVCVKAWASAEGCIWEKGKRVW